MGTGPKAGPGFDLALTEVIDGGRHDLVVEVGTERGAEVAEAVPHRPAESADLYAARAVLAAAEGNMGRSLDTEGLKDLLYRRYEDPRWDEVAKRCLACANCTMVCPTCFCATVEDETDLQGTATERRRIWDSCFSQEFSYVHAGGMRPHLRGARYGSGSPTSWRPGTSSSASRAASAAVAASPGARWASTSPRRPGSAPGRSTRE